jgi:hypothetical protein
VNAVGLPPGEQDLLLLAVAQHFAARAYSFSEK